MAEKRMFSKKVVDSDAFLDLPPGARLLYFELGVRCDDDGFCACPGTILRMTGASRGDLGALIGAGFLLDFDGVVVLRDWRVHNSLRSDRLKPVTFPKLAEKLWISGTGSYTTVPEENSMNLLEYRIRFAEQRYDPLKEIRSKSSGKAGFGCESQDRIGEDRISQDRISQDKTVQYSAEEGREGETALGLTPEGPDGFDCAESAEEASSERLEPLGGELGQDVLWLTDAQMTDLLERMSLEEFQRYTRRLSDYILKKGDRFHSHYRTILKWWEADKAVDGPPNSYA